VLARQALALRVELDEAVDQGRVGVFHCRFRRGGTFLGKADARQRDDNRRAPSEGEPMPRRLVLVRVAVLALIGCVNAALPATAQTASAAA
jgi:hypothetical protein